MPFAALTSTMRRLRDAHRRRIGKQVAERSPGGELTIYLENPSKTRERSMTNSPPRLSPSMNKLAWSNLAAQSAEQIGLAAAPMLPVLAFHVEADATAWLHPAQTLPFLLFSLSPHPPAPP